MPMGHAGLDGDFFRTDRKLLFAEQGITKVEQMLKSLNSTFFHKCTLIHYLTTNEKASM
jgi:hypothetical protein